MYNWQYPKWSISEPRYNQDTHTHPAALFPPKRVAGIGTVQPDEGHIPEGSTVPGFDCDLNEYLKSGNPEMAIKSSTVVNSPTNQNGIPLTGFLTHSRIAGSFWFLFETCLRVSSALVAAGGVLLSLVVAEVDRDLGAEWAELSCPQNMNACKHVSSWHHSAAKYQRQVHEHLPNIYTKYRPKMPTQRSYHLHNVSTPTMLNHKTNHAKLWSSK